jgi:two-component system cell cycle response regulator
VNDTYGHDAGDQVLKEFASRIRSTVRGADLACRYGGEEFVVVMPDTPGEVAASIAERLRMAVETVPFTLRDSGQVLNVTASFGISSRIGTVETADQLIKQADLALYAAKNSGRNRVVAAAA